ncbi:MAG: beta-ketoacyl synthase N-terminal-like domain-containing protein [Flavobacterium sp.]
MILKSPIAITGLASLSPLGSERMKIVKSYQDSSTCILTKQISDESFLMAPLSPEKQEQLYSFRNNHPKYKSLDNVVLMAIMVSREAIQEAAWQKGDSFGINFGSSRGATQLFEKYHQEYLETGKAPTLTSPTTTLGNISSWVSHDLQSQGPEISHSITCSTALHAVLNGVAWLQSGMVDKFLAGGSEAALTPFTFSQMQALKIYSAENTDYPCRPLDSKKLNNTMVLGEGAAAITMELGSLENALGYIVGVGYATEPLQHGLSISTDADCFQKSMIMALGASQPEDIDVVVLHAPGTLQGDASEMNAIEKVFNKHKPLLTSNKWKIGHTFGASGLLSLEMALLMLQEQRFFEIPYLSSSFTVKPIQKIMINAVGFGGNAVSVLLSK